MALKDHYSILADGNAGIFQTLDRMREIIKAPSSMVRRLAQNFPRTDAGVEEVFYWVRTHMLYLEHPPSEQTLTTPDALLSAVALATDGRAIGDCVDYTVLIGAILYAMGFPLKLVVRSTRADRVFDHVYLRVQLSRGWVPVDGSSSAALGWEEEDADVTARDTVPL